MTAVPELTRITHPCQFDKSSNFKIIIPVEILVKIRYYFNIDLINVEKITELYRYNRAFTKYEVFEFKLNFAKQRILKLS